MFVVEQSVPSSKQGYTPVFVKQKQSGGCPGPGQGRSLFLIDGWQQWRGPCLPLERSIWILQKQYHSSNTHFSEITPAKLMGKVKGRRKQTLMKLYLLTTGLFSMSVSLFLFCKFICVIF